MVSGGFIVIWIILAARIFSSKRKLHEIPSYIAYLNIVTMGLCTSFFGSYSDLGGICADYFG